MRKPFFRTARQCWYVKDDSGKAYRLDPDKDAAFQLWHEMQAAGMSTGPRTTVRGLLNAFMADLKDTMAKARWDALNYYASLFAEDMGIALALDVKPNDVTRWLAKPKPGRKRNDGTRGNDVIWSNSSRRHAAALLRRAWRWAHNDGRIAKNTLAELKLPDCDYRDDVIEVDVHKKLVTHCQSNEEARPFALYLIASRCGARPQQIREVTAKHVNQEVTQWVFKKHKTVGKTKKPIVVYLSPCLQTLTRILMACRSHGPLFRNVHGNPWKSDTVTQRIERLRTKLGLPENTVIYLYRHTMATDAFKTGHSENVVAHLLGHVDSRMVARVYGHLSKDKKFLENAANDVHRKRLGF